MIYVSFFMLESYEIVGAICVALGPAFIAEILFCVCARGIDRFENHLPKLLIYKRSSCFILEVIFDSESVVNLKYLPFLELAKQLGHKGLAQLFLGELAQ